MHAPSRLRFTALLLAGSALALAAFGCARPNSNGRMDGSTPGEDSGRERMDGGVPGVDTVCGPAGEACCAGSTCELGLRCARGACCLAANSSTQCDTASDCCAGLTCTNRICCAGRGSTCTGSSDCCSGLACSAGVCVQSGPDHPLPGPAGCGAPGAVCCDSFVCNSGLACDATGHCVGCGEDGDHCCDGMTPCVAGSLVCNPASGNCEPAPDPENRCGRIDGPCCGADGVSPGNESCEGDLVCTSGMCSDPTDSGGMGQPCSPRGGCDSGLMCDHTNNQCTMTPDDCGHDSQMCCDTGATAQSCDGNQHCQFGMCSTCQGPSLTCVLGGILPGQTCCNGSVCRPAPLLPRCCVGQDQPCTNSLDCCGFMMCQDGMCAGGRMNSLCVDSSECGDGLTCQNFQCKPDPMSMCAPPGQMCEGTSGCCDGTCGVAHNATMTTAPTVCCTPHDSSCENNDDCCGNMLCVEQICECRDIDETCYRDSECCEMGTDTVSGATGNLGCVSGACQIVDGCRRPGDSTVTCHVDPVDPSQPTGCCRGLYCLLDRPNGMEVCCQQGGSPCQRETDCCGEMACTDGHCICRGDGETCANDIDCCGSLVCTNGHCGI